MQAPVHSSLASSSRRSGKVWVWVVSCLVLVGGGVAVWLILSNRVSSDFDLVPRNAQVFATIRVADALESDQVKKLKKLFEEIGGEGFAKGMKDLSIMEDMVGMKLSDIERATFVGMNVARGTHDTVPSWWVILHTKKDIDEDKVLALLQGHEEKTHAGKAYYLQKDKKRDAVALHFVNARLAVVASATGMESCLDVAKNGPGSGPLKDALKLASKDKYHAVIGLNFKELLDGDERARMERQAGKAEGSDRLLVQAALKLETITCTMRFDKSEDTEIIGQFASRDAAKDAAEGLEDALPKLRAMVKEGAKEVPALASMADAFDDLKPEQSGSTVTLRVKSGPVVLLGLMMPNVHRVREAAARAQTENNLKQIGQAVREFENDVKRRPARENFQTILDAVHNYASDNGAKFPPSAIRDPAGKPLLSWRVALLPYINQGELYRQFKLDEPWDSPHNIKLIDRMPAVYDPSNASSLRPGDTFVQLMTGPGTLYPMPGSAKYNIGTIPDGSTNVIFLAIAVRPVPWTSPQDIVIDQGAIKPKLRFDERGLPVVYCDGSVRHHRKSITEMTLRKLIDPDDGIYVDPNDE